MYGPGKCVPHIHLQVMCEQKSPVQEYVTVALTGTKQPVSFIIDCDPPHIPSMSSYNVVT